MFWTPEVRTGSNQAVMMIMRKRREMKRKEDGERQQVISNRHIDLAGTVSIPPFIRKRSLGDPDTSKAIQPLYGKVGI